MLKYRFLEHTGETKFQAFGKTLEEAFSNSGLALASLMWDYQAIKKKKEIPVQVEGKDLAQLLVNFLEEIVYLFEVHMFLLSSAEKLQIEKKREKYVLKGCFKGDNYSPSYQASGEVKAITYHQLKIKKNHHYLIQVVVDV